MFFWRWEEDYLDMISKMQKEQEGLEDATEKDIGFKKGEQDLKMIFFVRLVKEIVLLLKITDFVCLHFSVQWVQCDTNLSNLCLRLCVMSLNVFVI